MRRADRSCSRALEGSCIISFVRGDSRGGFVKEHEGKQQRNRVRGNEKYAPAPHGVAV